VLKRWLFLETVDKEKEEVIVIYHVESEAHEIKINSRHQLHSPYSPKASTNP
jgi:hypothetical protein